MSPRWAERRRQAQHPGHGRLRQRPTAPGGISEKAVFEMSQAALQEIANLETGACGGDCHAAYRLASYHCNFTLKSEDAIHWFRLTIKCPETNPKLELIALLMGYQDPAHMAEIRQLIQDLSKTGSNAAKRVEEAVTKARGDGKG